MLISKLLAIFCVFLLLSNSNVDTATIKVTNMGDVEIEVQLTNQSTMVKETIPFESILPETTTNSLDVLSGSYRVAVSINSSLFPVSLIQLMDDTTYSLVIYHEDIWYSILLVITTSELLGFDQAIVNVAITSNKSKEYSISGISTNCYKCLTVPLWPNKDNPYFVVNTDYPYLIQVNFNNKTLFEQELKFEDHASYSLIIKESGDHIYSLKQLTDIPPIPYWTPIFIAIGVLLGLAILWVFSVKLWQKKCTHQEKMEEAKPLVSTTKTSRVVSLDAFRGLAITIMIFVNYGGGGYWFFSHSTWNGLTIADLVFPWFIWIMGTAMAISLKTLSIPGLSKFHILFKICKRTVILFGLGLFLNNGHDLSVWRIPGVLQRFSITYLLVSLIMMVPPLPLKNPKTGYSRINVTQTDNESDPELIPTQKPSLFYDVVPFAFQWMVTLGLLAFYLFLQFYVDVPGCGRGYLGPGGIGDYGMYKTCTGGAHGYIDKIVFGVQHIYQKPTCSGLYFTGPYDPEGLLGVFTSVLLCFLGVQAGRIICTYQVHSMRIIRWVVWGLVTGLIGVALCYGSKNDGIIPINKNLWSLSFIMVMSGISFLLLAIFYLVIDVFDIWNGAPFVYVGMNPILIYCGHEILSVYFPFSYEASATHGAQLIKNLIGVSSWLLIAYQMYLSKFFISI